MLNQDGEVNILTRISDNVQNRLSLIQETRTLPNNPNLGGILKETTIVHVITSGEYETPNLINLDLKVSLACEYREDSANDDRKSLNELITIIIATLHNSFIPGCKKTQFKKFEIFTPESGKWRALIEFETPVTMPSIEPLEEYTGLIDKVGFEYVSRCP